MERGDRDLAGVALRERLEELSQPIYGTKKELYVRMSKAEDRRETLKKLINKCSCLVLLTCGLYPFNTAIHKKGPYRPLPGALYIYIYIYTYV